VPGGSAANVMKGLANMLARDSQVRFVGMIGSDTTGQEYLEKLTAEGVEPLLQVGQRAGCGLRSAPVSPTPLPTPLRSAPGAPPAGGRAAALPQRALHLWREPPPAPPPPPPSICEPAPLTAPDLRAPAPQRCDSGAPSATSLCLVTPDGQRTMRTCLGASLELQSASMLPGSWSDGCQLLHCEGYCLYRPQLAAEMMRAAKARGALVSMDLASFEVRGRGLLRSRLRRWRRRASRGGGGRAAAAAAAAALPSCRAGEGPGDQTSLARLAAIVAAAPGGPLGAW
jgi:hypothetical protein